MKRYNTWRLQDGKNKNFNSIDHYANDNGQDKTDANYDDFYCAVMYVLKQIRHDAKSG